MERKKRNEVSEMGVEGSKNRRKRREKRGCEETRLVQRSNRDGHGTFNFQSLNLVYGFSLCLIFFCVSKKKNKPCKCNALLSN